MRAGSAPLLKASNACNCYLVATPPDPPAPVVVEAGKVTARPAPRPGRAYPAWLICLSAMLICTAGPMASPAENLRELLHLSRSRRQHSLMGGLR